MPPPTDPKIYHIVHVDRLKSIVDARCLWSDARVSKRGDSGPVIGMQSIKTRRRTNELQSHPSLHVGDCVPFYFCPRSVMLYLIHMGNAPGLQYRGGQDPIVHLQADLRETVAWANQEGHRWAFTLSNAGSSYFQDRNDLDELGEINWEAVKARMWNSPELKEGKQAEFLIEDEFPWPLIERIGVRTLETQRRARAAIEDDEHRPTVSIQRPWYYS